MTRGKRTARVEGQDVANEPKPVAVFEGFVPGDTPLDIQAVIDDYKARFDDWTDIARWPLESGLIHMSEKLKG